MNHLIVVNDRLGYLFQIKGNNDKRYFDVNNDIYPPPLMNQSPSYKQDEPAFYATIYFQYQRLKDIIEKHQNDNANEIIIKFEKEIAYKIYEKYYTSKYINFDIYFKEFKSKYNLDNIRHHWPNIINKIFDENNIIDIYSYSLYQGNILYYICSYLPSNIFFEGNEYIWNKTFLTIIKTLSIQNLNKMINVERILPIMGAFQSKKYLYALILLHYGAKVNISLYKNELPSFWTSEKLNIVLNSDKPPGQKLLSLIEKDYVCPISLSKIENPVIIEDGTIYEESSIIYWMNKNTKSPITNLHLEKWWIMFNIKTNKFIYSDSSLAILNMFEGYDNCYIK